MSSEPPQAPALAQAPQQVQWGVALFTFVKEQGFGIVILAAFVVSIQFGYLTVGPKLGGADPDYLNTLNAKLDATASLYVEHCGNLPEKHEEAVAHFVKANKDLFKTLRTKDRQRYVRLLYLFQDVIDNACAAGGKKWKKKYLDEADDLLDEDDPDPMGLRGTDAPPRPDPG